MRLTKILALALALISPLAVRAQNVITTVAGGGSTNVPALTVSIGGPSAAVKDALGNFYILDDYQNRVFKLDTTGNLTIFAGNGTPGYSGDGGLPTSAQFNGPRDLFIDASQNIFIADADNGVIREIPKNSGLQYGINMTAGNIYTVAGNFALGLGYGGDGGPATSAQMDFPDGVWVDGTGDIFIGDKANHIVREVAAATGTHYGIAMVANNIYTIAGIPNPGAKLNGFSGDGGLATSAMLNNPWGVYGDKNGNIFIADSSNCLIREVVASTGIITTFAGTVPTLPSPPNPPSCGFSGDQGLATAARLKNPLGVLVDGSGNVFISDTDNEIVREVPSALGAGTNYGIPMTANKIYTVAGMPGARGHGLSGVPATTTDLATPGNVFVDSSGNLFISDTDGHEVREVAGPTPSTGQVTGDIYDFAGNGFQFWGGDLGPATNAEFSNPIPAPPAPFAQAIGIATDAAGDFFIADTENDLIREVTASDGNMHTIVGGAGNDSFSGDGGPATSGRIAEPNGVFVDSHNNIFIADTANCLIREVVASTGNIKTVAGTAPNPSTNPPVCGLAGDQGLATTAELNAPNGVFVDGSGNIFIADTLNHAIREIPAITANGKTAGNIYTVVGTLNMAGQNGEGVVATGALLNSPQGVFVDSFGNIFLTDTANNIVREVPFADGKNYGIPMTANSIYTVAGTPTVGGYSGDGGPGPSAELMTPFGVLVDDGGNIFISDTGNHIIREVAASNGNISTIAGKPQTAGFGGDGLAAVNALLNAPQGLAAGITRNLLIADSVNTRIRSIGGLLAAPASAATLDKKALTFTPAQLVGSTSAAQTITLTDNGTADLTITSITVGGTNPGDFAISADTCPVSPTKLALGTSCTISVKFTPTANLARTGSITIADDAANSPQTVGLTGTGGTPTATPNPASLTFANQFVNTPSTPQVITITNTGAVALHVTNIAVSGTNSGDFTLTPANTCVGTPVAASGGTCTISVTFAPTAAGNNRTGLITITDDASPTKQTINLTGNGVAPAVGLSPTSLTFTAQLLNTPSAAQSVTLTNNGSAALNITNVAVSGTNSADFAQTNTCGTSVAAAAKCTISVTFTPGALGSRTASITVSDNATGGTQTIALTGTGVLAPPAVGLSSMSLMFSDQLVGTTASAAQTVTLTNNGKSALTIASIAVSTGDFAETDTCPKSPATLAAAANCVISATFAPSASGVRSATVTITDNAAGSPRTVSLGGHGVALSLAAASNGSITQTVKAGQTATYNLQLSETGAASLTDSFSVAVTCAGAPSLATCSAPATPVVVTPAGPAAFSITVSTTASAIAAPGVQSEPRVQPPAAIRTVPLFLMALLSVAVMLAWMQSPAGRMRTVRLAFVAGLLLLPVSATMLLGGCASGSSGSTPTPTPKPGTPAGTSTLTITATANGKSQTSTLTLIVQ